MNPAPATAVTPARPGWRPAIAQDDCTGCGRCITACPPACLGLVWDFATLVRAADCDGCSRCETACPHGVIRMVGPPFHAGA